MSEWSELTRLTRGAAVVVERVRLQGSQVAVEGSFDLPVLAALAAEDQVFVAAFVKSHGSIREMERLFGVSYPTVKNRLNRIGERLAFAEPTAAPTRADILKKVERGEISVDEAVEEIERC